MTFRAKNQKSVLYYKCTLRENYFLGIFGVKTHYIIGHKKFKKVACIIKVELEKKDTISRVGGGGTWIFALCIVGVTTCQCTECGAYVQKCRQKSDI